MEHMRFAVTHDPVANPSASKPSSGTSSPPASTSTSPPPESDAYGVPASYAPVRKPATRSHDPANNQKRTDPFSFGSRYLEEGDDIFEFNAWDHVEVDASYQAFSEEQFSRQRSEPVSDFDKKRFNDNPEKWWNLFYKNNKAGFFKNRKWLAQEFPILDEVTREESPPATLLEVGAGAGNSAFPILAKNKNKGLKIHACDFSKTAVDVIRGNEAYDTQFIQADVWDVAASPDSENAGLPPGLAEGSVDVVLMIFIFSALNPRQWDQAKGRYMEENFYVRGDGTRVYFFEQEELKGIWDGSAALPGSEAAPSTEQQTEETDPPATDLAALSLSDRPQFETVHFGVDRRMLVNRQRRLKMYRCWMQAVFRKAGHESEVPTSTIRQDKGSNREAEGEAEGKQENGEEGKEEA
ncbi:methyltransferase [Corynespora cassiicola Philippines]|uniref:Methyltransferase n=1 Tax=Corynespora cassiicola Philippines TaxID=1448308 RepID=A0A2T2NJ41_CORCC|nr:methyltransferase [Corynespora cassiicola Philippines]